MTPKKDDSEAAQMKAEGSKSSATTNTGPSDQSFGLTTQIKAKATVAMLAQTSLLLKPTLIFCSNLPKTSIIFSNLL